MDSFFTWNYLLARNSLLIPVPKIQQSCFLHHSSEFRILNQEQSRKKQQFLRQIASSFYQNKNTDKNKFESVNMSTTEGKTPADGEKSASQLKKEAKRLAKLEKFNKKQEQQSKAQKSAEKEVYFYV